MFLLSVLNWFKLIFYYVLIEYQYIIGIHFYSSICNLFKLGVIVFSV